LLAWRQGGWEQKRWWWRLRESGKKIVPQSRHLHVPVGTAMGWEEDPPILPSRSSSKDRQPSGEENRRRTKKRRFRKVGEEDAAGRTHRFSGRPFNPIFRTPRAAAPGMISQRP
jgi:hypothetical protein